MTEETRQILSRLDILNADDFVTDEVHVPEWGGWVRVRELNSKEADEVGFGMIDRKGQADARKMKGMYVRIVTWACMDEKDKPIFEQRDVERLARKGAGPVRALARRIMELSGITPPDDEPRPWSLECPHCEGEFEVDLNELAKEYEEDNEGPN